MTMTEEETRNLVNSINAGDKAAMDAVSRWTVEGLWLSGKLYKYGPLRDEILAIVESCRESR